MEPKAVQEIAAALSAEFGTKVLGVTEDEYGNVLVKVQENSLYTREFGVSRWGKMEGIVDDVRKELKHIVRRNGGGETGDTGWNNEV